LGFKKHQSRNSKGIVGVVTAQQELDSPWAWTKAKMNAAVLRPCHAARLVSAPGGNRSVPSPAALRIFSASAWNASSSVVPRYGCGGPQAPWPNKALHRTAQKSAPLVNLVVGSRGESHMNRINIDDLSEAELIDLNHRIVERLRFINQMRAHKRMLDFKIGDRVTFQPDGRPSVVGMLTRYNKKSVTVITDDGHRWNVSPAFIRMAELETPAESGKITVLPLKQK
jgi:hypothetical protein